MKINQILNSGKSRGYFLRKDSGDQAVRYNNEFMVKPNWAKQIEGRDLKWLIKHFWPIPGWSKEWEKEFAVD